MTSSFARLRLLVPALVFGLVAVACAAEPEATAQPTESTATEAVESTEEPTTDATDHPMETPSSDTETAAQTAGSGPFGDLKQAATHVAEMSGPAIAGGVAQAAGIEGVDTDGAQLKRALSAELQEHVYLAAIALEQLLLDRGPAVEAATAALDENSVELADLVGSVAPDQRDAFLELWRNHIGFFVDYTMGVKAGDEAAKSEALAQLDQYRADAGAFFETVTGGALPADAVASSLEEHVATTIATIDAFAAGDPAGFDQLKAAADHVASMSGPALAGGIAEATGMEGVDSPGSDLLTSLSTTLQEHVYLTGVFVEQSLANPAAAAAAAATLDRNSVQLADIVGSVAPGQRDAFLELWRNHIGFFADYTAGVAAGDEAVQEEALAQLEQYQQDAGAFFETVTGGALPADAVASSLDEHVTTTITAIDNFAVALDAAG